MRSPWPRRRRTHAPRFGGGRSPGGGGAGGHAGPRFELTSARPIERPVGRQRGLLRLPHVPWRRLLLGTALTATLAALAALTLWVVQGDMLRVDHVTVLGTRSADPVTVAEVADAGGRSLLTLDTAELAARVMALPAVRRATVRRDWPRGLIVDVTEQQGWGYWQAAGQRVLIDRDGLVLDRARPPREGAPTIIELAAVRRLRPGDRVDRDTVRLVDALVTDGSFDRLRVRPERFEFHRERGLTVRVAGGPDAVFGDSHDYEFKVAAWGALLDRLERAGDALTGSSELDLRFGRQLVLR